MANILTKILAFQRVRPENGKLFETAKSENTGIPEGDGNSF